MPTLLDYASGNARTGLENIKPDFSNALVSFFGANPGLGMYSGYRSIARQKELWDASDKSGKMVAAPGRSFHNFGEAADLTFNGVRLDRLPKEQQAALHESASKFGLTFPMDYEPWHVQPIGAQRQSNAQPGMMAGSPQATPANASLTSLEALPSQEALPQPGTGLIGQLTNRQQSEEDWLHNTSYSADAILSDMFAGKSPLKRYVFQKAANIFGALI